MSPGGLSHIDSWHVIASSAHSVNAVTLEAGQSFLRQAQDSATKRASPLHARVRTCASPRLETAFLAGFFAWNWIATGSGRASRRATAESANGGRENG